MKGYWVAGIGFAASLHAGTALARRPPPAPEAPVTVPHTLQEALAAAYLSNPVLRKERATLRATDEQVPAALGGWRPTITGTANMSYYSGSMLMAPEGGGNGYARRYDLPGYGAGVNISEPIYTGGRTTASTHRAVHDVMAERARLILTEQQVFTDVVNAYVGVIEDQQILQIDINNEKLYQEQLHTTELRAHGGEITHTDVAQAQAALSAARATRQQAEGTLEAARATYLQVVGTEAPDNLQPPQPLVLPVQSEQDATARAVENNPSVIAALFDEAARKDAVGVAFAALLPSISAQASYAHDINQEEGRSNYDNKMALVSASVPIYQGGSEYAAVRAAKQQVAQAHRAVEAQRRSAIQLAQASWQRILANRAAITSNREAISANISALAGVERQAIVGTGTTLAVLQQQETLLQAQVALVMSLGSLVQASYQEVAAIGRLTARDLNLDVPLYNEKAYYKAVHDRLWGISDYALKEPGR